MSDPRTIRLDSMLRSIEPGQYLVIEGGRPERPKVRCYRIHAVREIKRRVPDPDYPYRYALTVTVEPYPDPAPGWLATEDVLYGVSGRPRRG